MIRRSKDGLWFRSTAPLLASSVVPHTNMLTLTPKTHNPSSGKQERSSCELHSSVQIEGETSRLVNRHRCTELSRTESGRKRKVNPFTIGRYWQRQQLWLQKSYCTQHKWQLTIIDFSSKWQLSPSIFVSLFFSDYLSFFRWLLQNDVTVNRTPLQRSANHNSILKQSIQFCTGIQSATFICQYLLMWHTHTHTVCNFSSPEGDTPTWELIDLSEFTSSLFFQPHRFSFETIIPWFLTFCTKAIVLQNLLQKQQTFMD